MSAMEDYVAAAAADRAAMARLSDAKLAHAADLNRYTRWIAAATIANVVVLIGSVVWALVRHGAR